MVGVAGPARFGRGILGRRRQWVGLMVLVLVAAYFAVPPFVYMLGQSLTPPAAGAAGGVLALYEGLFRSPGLGRLVSTTVIFAAATMFASMAAGILMAWLVERTNCAWKSLSYAAAFVSFAVPGMVRALGWPLMLRHGGPGHMFNVLTLGGMIFVESSFWVPLVFLLMIAPLRMLDATYEEAATAAGASPIRTTWRVTAPLLLPSILSVAVLCFIRIVQAFEVPLFIGVPARVQVFTTQIYLGLTQALVPDYGQASAYGMLMLVALSGILIYYHRLTRDASRFHTVSARGFRSRRTDLGAWRWVGATFLLLVFLVEVVPAAYMVLLSLQRTAAAALTSSGLTLASYRTLAANPGVVRSVLDSLQIAFVSATAAVLIAAAASWYAVRSALAARWVPDWLLGFPLVYPGIVMGVAVLIFYLHFPLAVYGTIWIMVLAYIPTFAPYASRYVHPALVQLNRELEESGAASGAPPSQVFRRILVPLLMPALIGAWLFIFLISVRELSVASLLYTPASPVVATQFLNMWTNGEIGPMSAFGTLVTLFSIGVAASVFGFTRRFGIQA